MHTVMLVEDDPTIRMELEILLKNAGYEVVVVEEFCHVAEQICERAPHLVLMDVMLPGQTGIEICLNVRKISKVPIIFVTNCNTTADEIRCITMGGDDFVAKPYNVAILLARITNILKRTYGQKEQNDLLVRKGVTLNVESGKISYQDKEAELTWNEVKILTCLYREQKGFVSRNALIQYMWENKLYIDDNTLNVNMTRIRKKLKDIGVVNFIETKRGLGYKI